MNDRVVKYCSKTELLEALARRRRTRPERLPKPAEPAVGQEPARLNIPERQVPVC